jgi:hypothetical protein
MFCFSFFFSQSSVHPGWDRQSPSRWIRTHQTKTTKTQNGKKFNKPKQQSSRRKSNKRKKKKKKKSPTIKPKQQKPNHPLNHSPEIIKPKQEKPKIRLKIRLGSVSWPDLLHLRESVDLDLYLSGRDPLDSSSVFDHGSISKSLSPAFSVSLFHLPLYDSM